MNVVSRKRIGAVEYSPFYGIEKGAVLQEARVFNEAHADPRKCQQVITKLLYLLTQGESLTKVGETRFGVWIAKQEAHCGAWEARYINVIAANLILRSTTHYSTDGGIRRLFRGNKAVSAHGCAPAAHGIPGDQGGYPRL